ncbi:MAG: hypothetical protein WBW81_04425 [Methylocella sp.]
MPVRTGIARRGLATPHGWLRIAAIVGCGISCTAASAHCAIVGLGGAISLMTCSGGTTGNGTGMTFDLGNGLTSYRLSNGVSGMLYLVTSSTSANAIPSATSAQSSGPSVPAPAGSTASSNGTASPVLTAPSSGTIFYLVNGSIKSAPATASGSHELTPINIPINTPLTPPMTNVAASGIAVPTPGPGKATGAAANATGPALGDAPQ